MPKLNVAHTPENDALDAPLLSALRSTPSPYRLRGKVVSGFGRGSKLLGCPTANLEPCAFAAKLAGVPRGVYMGFAQVGAPGPSNPVYKTVLSLGTNPTFAEADGAGSGETVESYIMHEFGEDFYGQQISLVILAYLRPMDKYEGLDKLIRAIERDVRVGDTALDLPEYCAFKEDAFFKEP